MSRFILYRASTAVARSQHDNSGNERRNRTMDVTQVSDNIFRLSANVGEEILFEGMWPLPHGLSMNSYIVKGDKVAIVSDKPQTCQS